MISGIDIGTCDVYEGKIRNEEISKWESSWIGNIVNSFPELCEWLGNENVQITNEGVSSKDSSYSEQLFGKKYVEFDRSVLTLQCLDWFLSDNPKEAYKLFTQDQEEKAKLSYKSFLSIHELAKYLIDNNPLELSSSEMTHLMRAALVLGDLGKSDKAREQFDVSRKQVPDHDDCYRVVMNKLIDNPKLSKTFNQLSKVAQQHLVDTAIDVHFGHITHLEGGPEMFSGLKNSKLTQFQLDFEFFIHFCDVSGALGHIKPYSSLVLTENTYQAMEANRKACSLLVGESSKTEKDAYDFYLAQRGNWLGLDHENLLERILIRMGAMMRLFSKEEGEILKKGIDALKEEDQKRLISYFNTTEVLTGRTPTYMPAVLVNLANNKTLGETPAERLECAIAIGLPVIGRALEMYKNYVDKGEIDEQVPLNFNPLAKIASGSPKDFETGELTIDTQGNVSLVNTLVDLTKNLKV